MVNFVNLRQTGSGWEFESEAALEDFLEENLPDLFGLHPLKRQHYVNEQFGDIVAVGDNKNLVILELKNTEDRYVVQQLTRYYDGLRNKHLATKLTIVSPSVWWRSRPVSTGTTSLTENIIGFSIREVFRDFRR
jgi:RecB family endonuclease NucS